MSVLSEYDDEDLSACLDKSRMLNNDIYQISVSADSMIADISYFFFI